MRKGEMGEIAACSPLAPAATEDCEAHTFSLSFSLCLSLALSLPSSGYTSGFNLEAVSSASD